MLLQFILLALSVAALDYNDYFNDDYYGNVYQTSYSKGATITNSYYADAKTISDFDTLGTWNGDKFTFTVAPGSFNCPLCRGVPKSFYSDLYRELKGKVPVESLAFPGGVLPGKYGTGGLINSTYYYFKDPDGYKSLAADTWGWFKFNRTEYVSTYESLWEKHSGLIPITAFDGARTVSAAYLDDYSGVDWDVTAKSIYHNYKQSQWNVEAQSLDVLLIEENNGVYFTHYQYARYNSPFVITQTVSGYVEASTTEPESASQTETSAETSRKDEESSSAAEESTKSNSIDVSEESSAETSARKSQEAKSSQSNEANHSTSQTASTSSKAAATIIAPFSGVVLLGLMML
ncbi:hypothetical protein DICA4_B04258 [Diutina catenulata]